MMDAKATVRSIEFDWEQIEITQGGLLPPFKADPYRRFVKGLATVYVTMSDGTELPPMNREEYAQWWKENME